MSLATNILSIAVALLGLVIPTVGPYLWSAGIFAFSGAITNWLAIHMLFEKVPYLKGSGVIQLRFADFKRGIHGLIMRQFFTKENVARLLAQAGGNGGPDLSKVKDAINYDQVWSKISKAALDSPIGGMLGMFGGERVLQGMRPKIEAVLKDSVDDILASDAVKNALGAGLSSEAVAEGIVTKVDRIVQARLDELTPDDVKRIVQDMIREHLGWLVVWGGVFGGIIGLASAVIDRHLL